MVTQIFIIDFIIHYNSDLFLINYYTYKLTENVFIFIYLFIYNLKKTLIINQI